MKRILLLVTVAAMLAGAMALSGVAQAKPVADPADAQCLKLAMQTLDPGFNPSNYTFFGGTEGEDNFTVQATAGHDVFCGFGGDDDILGTLEGGDIFLGGAGNDYVFGNNGTFYGGAGIDYIFANRGTFYGGADDDRVVENYGTFYGQEGFDQVTYDFGGTFEQ